MVTIKRGCSAVGATLECSGAESDRIKFKDCQYSCPGVAGDACNDDLTVGDKFGQVKQIECHQCKWLEFDDGNVNGNKNCLEDAVDENISGACPNYASNGCYTGASIHSGFGDGVMRNEVKFDA